MNWVMIQTHALINLPIVAVSMFLTLYAIKFAFGRKIIGQYKVIAFLVSWGWSTVIAYTSGNIDDMRELVTSLAITIAATSIFVFLVTKK